MSRVVAVLVLALALELGRAEAQQEPSRAAAQAADPQALFAVGVAQFGRRRFEAAVDAFTRVLAADPNHAQARAYLARSEVLWGDQLAQRGGDPVQQQEHYRRALEADPGLLGDPAFRERYRSASLRQPPLSSSGAALAAESAPPRQEHWVGLLIANGWAGGPLGLQVGALVLGRFHPTLTFGTYLRALDFGAKLIPLSGRWSPYVGAGFWHRVDLRADDTCSLNDAVHIDVGAQLMTHGGLALNLGAGFMVNNRGPRSYSSGGATSSCGEELWLVPLPQVDFGWFF